MSPESLRAPATSIPQTVLQDYNAIGKGEGGNINTFLKMGLIGVLSTQLWHHLYMGGGLCELPDHSARPQVERPYGTRPALAPAAE